MKCEMWHHDLTAYYFSIGADWECEWTQFLSQTRVCCSLRGHKHSYQLILALKYCFLFYQDASNVLMFIFLEWNWTELESILTIEQRYYLFLQQFLCCNGSKIIRLKRIKQHRVLILYILVLRLTIDDLIMCFSVFLLQFGHVDSWC